MILKKSLILFLISCLHLVNAEPPKERSRAIFTNAFAPLRISQAINFEFHRYNSLGANGITVFGADFIFNFLNFDNNDARLLNSYITDVRTIGFDFYLGQRYFVDKSGFNIGAQLHLAYLPFRHSQIICTESTLIVDDFSSMRYCRCDATENYSFNTNNIRTGLMLRMGYLFNRDKKNQFEIFGQIGFFGYARTGFEGIRSHNRCELSLFEDPFVPLGESLFNFLKFQVDRDRPLAVAIQIGLNIKLTNI
jgi:hypothetical protein